MNTIIPPLKSSSRRLSPAPVTTQAVRKPHYDCQERADSFQIEVYVPGVDPAGIEITTRGPDLLVTARKSHFVRVNFSSLNLEAVQNDYQLSLRLGRGLDYNGLHAEIYEGVLTLTIPKKQPMALPNRNELPYVA